MTAEERKKKKKGKHLLINETFIVHTHKTKTKNHVLRNFYGTFSFREYFLKLREKKRQTAMNFSDIIYVHTYMHTSFSYFQKPLLHKGRLLLHRHIQQLFLTHS